MGVAVHLVWTKFKKIETNSSRLNEYTLSSSVFVGDILEWIYCSVGSHENKSMRVVLSSSIVIGDIKCVKVRM